MDGLNNINSQVFLRCSRQQINILKVIYRFAQYFVNNNIKDLQKLPLERNVLCIRLLTEYSDCDVSVTNPDFNVPLKV